MGDNNPLAAIQNIQDASTFDLRLPHKDTNESIVMYKDLLDKGKTAAAAGNLTESLVAYQKAYKLKPTEKILQRIKKIEKVLKEMEDDKENDDFVQLDNGLIIYRQLVERLYPHQIEGVKWIYDLHKKRKKGGILADDMGLGKTIQVIAALSAMFDMELIQSVLLVLPLSLIPNWQREFEKWAPGIKLKSFYGTANERTKNLDYAQRRPSVCLTTYGLVVTQWEQLGQTRFRQRFVWDYIVLDEGHKIKNPSKTTKGLHAIPSKNRLILTGTPIQNNLRELWALFDWVTQGTLLGTQKTFKMEYDTPITRARQRGASSAEIHLGNYMSESLRKIIEPFIMRRTKALVSAASKTGSEKVDQNQPSFPKLKKKNDFVIWTYLSEVQKEIYRDFLAQDSIKELLASKRSPLVYLTILKKICDHPRLLPRRACHQLGLEANDSLNEEDFHTEKGKECAANRIDNISDKTLIEESGKLQFLVGLLQRLREEGHRTLIFSLSRKVLNIIHRILLNYKFKVMRLDGTVSKLSERELRVQKFQQDSSYNVFLLTTQVGGVGLTLTAADRVVIFDPSWNPATDAQAVDRIYRIGQDKNVVVYRLITCGTVEEKIYRRQIFKDSIIKQSTGDNKDPYRYFTNHDLKELFQFDDSRDSVTQRQLQDLHSNQRCLDPKLDEHLAYLHSLPMFGVSDHDLMFSQDPDDVDAEAMNEHGHAIRNKVAEAQNRVELEAKNFTDTASTEAEQRWGDFDIKSKVSEQKTKEEEPVYQIEGLYDQIDSLKVEDDVIENIFNQSKISISIRSESDKDEAEPTGNVIDVPDSDDEDADTKSLNDAASNLTIGAIMVEDSPVRDRKDETVDMETLEIEESFVSDVGDVGSRKSKGTFERESLMENNISCISNQRSKDSTIQDKEEISKTAPERDASEPEDDEDEKDYFLDCASPGGLLLPESDSEEEDAANVEIPADDKETENANVGPIQDSREDAPKSPEDDYDLDLLQASANSKTDDVVQSSENQDKHEEEEMEAGILGEDADSLLDQDEFRRFSHLNEDSSSSMALSARESPTDPGENRDIAPLLQRYDIRYDLDEEAILNESPKGFFLDEADEEDESLIHVRGDKKNRRRLISDSDTDEEDVGAENSAESDNDNEDAGSMKDFLVYDETLEDHQDDSLPSFEISQNATDSPLCTTGKSTQKEKRRSTALPLPQIESSDESAEEEDFSQYRDETNNSSEAENSKFSALQFSFNSEDEDIY